MTSTIDQALDEWNALVQRERSQAYRVRTHPGEDGSPSPSSEGRYHPCPTELREEVCDWFYRVVDRLDIERDVVSVALSYLDRYIALDLSIDPRLLKLAATTSLYLAIKVHSNICLSARYMASASQGHFHVLHILQMETSMTWKLGWHLNPPIPLHYLAVAGPLIRDTLDGDEETSASVEDLARYLLELSACDGYFTDKEPSSTAHAAVSLAMEVQGLPGRRSFERRGLEHEPDTTRRCKERLQMVYKLAGQQMGTESPRTSAF